MSIANGGKQKLTPGKEELFNDENTSNTNPEGALTDNSLLDQVVTSSIGTGPETVLEFGGLGEIHGLQQALTAEITELLGKHKISNPQQAQRHIEGLLRAVFNREDERPKHSHDECFSTPGKHPQLVCKDTLNAAQDKFNKAKKLKEKRTIEKRERIELGQGQVFVIWASILADKIAEESGGEIKEARGHGFDMFIKTLPAPQKELFAELHEAAQKVAKTMASRENLTEKQIADFIENNETALEILDQEVDLGAHQAELRKLKDVFNAGENIAPYIKYFTEDIAHNTTLDLLRIWREGHLNEAPEETQKQFERLSNKANFYTGALLQPYTLAQEIVDCYDINELLTIARTTLPTTDKKLHLLRSALAKIHFMHLAYTIHQELDTERAATVSRHLREKLKKHSIETVDGRIILNPCEPTEKEFVISLEEEERKEGNVIKNFKEEFHNTMAAIDEAKGQAAVGVEVSVDGDLEGFHTITPENHDELYELISESLAEHEEQGSNCTVKIITKETMPRKKEAEAKRAIVELKATLKEFFSSTRGTRARVDIVTVNREGEEEILDYRNISAEDGVRKCGEIEEIISAYRSENNEGSIRMFLSTDPANEHSVILHALDVPDEKDDLSIARKLAHKASEIRSLDDIRDVIRFKYMFPKSIKDDPQVLEQEVIKALAVNFEIFGTDIVENRSRYGLVDGKSSAKSLGKHQAFHVTLYYRYQCSSNGHFDDPMEGRIAVEIQFQNYMGTSEEKRDHHDYTQKKNHQIKGRFGLEKTFPDFIIDLLDVFANNYEFISYEGTEADRFRGRPINERVALTLLSILTESDPQEPRILTNRKAIQEILGHEIHGRKLISVLKKLSEMKATRTQVSVSEEDWSKKVEVKEERDARAVQFHAQRAIESLSRLTGKRWSTLTEEYLGEE